MVTETPHMSVCLTGGAGVLGSLLTARLLKEGNCEVVILDKQDAGVHSGARYIRGSILKDDDLDRAIKRCDVICHLAALTHADGSQGGPGAYFDINVSGTVRVLEACRRHGVRRLIYVSTALVYGVPKNLPVTEDHPCRPLSIYGLSKLGGELAAQAYAVDGTLGVDVARMANLYGANLPAATVIGLALRQAARGESLAVRNLKPARDFLHVDDAVEALLALVSNTDSSAGSRVMNVSSGRSVRISEILDILAGIVEEKGGMRPEIVQTEPEESEVIPDIAFDNSLIRSLTGWQPKTSLEQGLQRSWMECDKGGIDD